MSTLNELVTQHRITSLELSRLSGRLEAAADGDAKLRQLRLRKRQTQPEATYASLNIAKPKLGRGLSVAQIDAVLSGGATSRLVRAKLGRALAARLTQLGQPADAVAQVLAAVPRRNGRAAAASGNG